MHLSPSHKLSEAQSPDRAATDQFSAAAYYVCPSLFKSSLFGPPSHFMSLPMYSPPRRGEEVHCFASVIRLRQLKQETRKQVQQFNACKLGYLDTVILKVEKR
jgi:hypothetical protein